MLVQLKQTEIVAALKMYVAAQGINLAGKTVDVTFTAGRKEAGMSADINIDDANDIPDCGEDEQLNGDQKPALTLVAGSTEDIPPAATTEANPHSDPAPEEDKAEEQEDAAPAPAKKSLFGSNSVG